MNSTTKRTDQVRFFLMRKHLSAMERVGITMEHLLFNFHTFLNSDPS